MALGKLQEVDSSFFDGTSHLAVKGRRLLFEGKLNKVCRNGWKPRYFWLCNDVLAYGTIMAPRRHAQHRSLPLSAIEVSPLDDPDLPNAFQVTSAQKSFQILAADPAERSRWLDEVRAGEHAWRQTASMGGY